MDPIFTRTARIIDEKGIECLQAKTVAVFGIGGVGSYAAEALVRAGVDTSFSSIRMKSISQI